MEGNGIKVKLSSKAWLHIRVVDPINFINIGTAALFIVVRVSSVMSIMTISHYLLKICVLFLYLLTDTPQCSDNRDS